MLDKSFEQYFNEKYPELNGEWGFPGELLSDVFHRVRITLVEYTSQIVDDFEADFNQRLVGSKIVSVV